MVTETTILVSCFVCVTPQCLRGHPGPCFCTQGSRRISEPCRASVCQVPLWPALWVCGQQDSHCATATHFPKNPWPVTLVLINCCCYARKSNLGAISQGKWDQALCSLSSSPELMRTGVCNCTASGKGDSFPADPHPARRRSGGPSSLWAEWPSDGSWVQDTEGPCISPAGTFGALFLTACSCCNIQLWQRTFSERVWESVKKKC